MANIPDHVEPGDIVQSDGYNGVIDALKDLEDRVALLEAGGVVGGGVAITSLAPAGDLRVGQELTIFGRNFGYSIGAQRVYFNSERVKVFKTGSNDQKLIIEIPDVPGVIEDGTPVTLTAANFTSSDSRQVTLKPVQLAQQGNPVLSFISVTPATIAISSTPKFKYQLEAPLLLPQPVTITPTVSIPSLQSSIKVLDASDQEIPSKQLTLQPGQPTQISIQLGVIPGGTTAIDLSVAVTGSGIPGTEDDHHFPLNAAINVDPGVPIFSPNASIPSGALSGNTLSVVSGTTGTIIFRAEFTGVDTRIYDVIAPTATGWTIARDTSFQHSTPATYTISGPDTKFPAFTAAPGGGAASPTNVEFTLQRQGTTIKKTIQVTLVKT
jgi:hypothetical protein